MLPWLGTASRVRGRLCASLYANTSERKSARDLMVSKSRNRQLLPRPNERHLSCSLPPPGGAGGWGRPPPRQQTCKPTRDPNPLPNPPRKGEGAGRMLFFADVGS